MRLHIITVYDSLNYGSYFQALALQWELKKYGSVYFVDVHHQDIRKATFKQCVKKIMRKQLYSAILDYKKLICFMHAQKIMPIIDMRKMNNVNAIFFFGSDEIWNIHRDKMRRTKEFFGQGFPEKYRVAIAPSINRTQIEEIKEYEYIYKELSKFKKISVRDVHTKYIIEEIIGRECFLVSDPTLMHKKNVYKKYEHNVSEEPYIMIYTYGEMFNEDVIRNICTFAKEENLKIISVGAWFEFCDKSIAASPGEFLGYINNAEYVITDTFHGLMFSLIYEKQFIVFPCGNIKVEEALDYLGLNERICLPSQNLKVKVKQRIDYSVITPRIEQYGKVTKKFIMDTIREIKAEIE